MKTKNLTWQEVLELPVETKIRLPWWGIDAYWFRKRDSRGQIEWRNLESLIHIDLKSVYQDKWEIYEDPKPKPKFITGAEALAYVYEGKKIAFDDFEWLKYYKYIHLINTGFEGEQRLACAGVGSVTDALVKKYFIQKKWYVVE